jgi:hypothetical protein
MKIVKWHHVLAIAIIAALAGCGLIGSEDSPRPLQIETDRGSYDLSRDSIIQVDIRNTSDETIYYSTCMGPLLEVIDDGRVVDTIGLPTCACLSPAEVKSNEMVPSSVSEVSIQAIVQEYEPPQTTNSLSYRLVFAHFFHGKAWGETLPLKQRRSTQFTLE